MNRSVLAVTGLGSLALGALAAGWLVALTPTSDGVPSTLVAPMAHTLEASRRDAAPDSAPAMQVSTPAPIAVPACQPAMDIGQERAAMSRPSSAPAKTRTLASVPPAPKPPVEARRPRPTSPVVAAVKTRVAKVVALLVPPRKPAPAAPRVDHRYDGVLTASEIGRIKGLLRLSSDQEAYWPPVAELLKTVGRRQTTAIQAGQPPDLNLGGDLMQFYYAARPLIQSLREDQKAEVRRLARHMGLSSVASYI